MTCLLASSRVSRWPLIASLVVAMAASASATGDPGLDPHGLASLRAVGQAEISPDGRQIAYTLVVPRRPGADEDGPAWSELHLIDHQGNLDRPFVTGRVNVRSLAWLPDGRQISFLAKRPGDEVTSLYLISTDGGEAQRILSPASDITAYSWSPDGTRLAFIASQPEDPESKWLSARGFKQRIYEEDWRPARLSIARPFEPPAAIHTLSLPGSVFQVAWCRSAKPGTATDDRLVVSLAPRPLVDDRYMSQKVHVIRSSGEILARIDNPGKLGQIGLDGDRVVMISAADINDPGTGRLLSTTLGATDRTPVDLLRTFPGDVTAFAVAPDGIKVLISQGVGSSFGEIDATPSPAAGAPGAGATLHQIFTPSSFYLSRFSLSKDGRHAAFIADSPEHPAELFTMSHGDEAPRRLTHSNPWLEQIPLARQEVVTWRARDGLDLQGILIYPLDETSGGPWPTIVSVHGGPESHHHDGWLTRYSSPGQVAAARGFAVFYPNYRGSTGRGPAFNKLGHGDAAGKEFDDIIDAVDHLIDIGVAARDKIGITGGSYGGYATAWCCTYYSDRFAAGVMFAGISNKISKSGTTDIPLEEYLVHARHYPWEDWEFFLKRSPVFHVQKARTPLLILHGTADKRVHVGQAMELYRHLRTLGQAPVRLVLYPGEGHGNRNAAARYDVNLRMLRWFEHYLQGHGGTPPDSAIDYRLDRSG